VQWSLFATKKVHEKQDRAGHSRKQRCQVIRSDHFQMGMNCAEWFENQTNQNAFL
jgi:hypothetical protein